VGYNVYMIKEEKMKYCTYLYLARSFRLKGNMVTANYFLKRAHEEILKAEKR
jgi:hypothetical protein